MQKLLSSIGKKPAKQIWSRDGKFNTPTKITSFIFYTGFLFIKIYKTLKEIKEIQKKNLKKKNNVALKTIVVCCFQVSAILKGKSTSCLWFLYLLSILSWNQENIFLTKRFV